MGGLRRVATALVALGLAAGAVIVTPATPAAAEQQGVSWTISETSELVAVIVQAKPGQLNKARQTVTKAEGDISRELPLVNGFAADIRADRVVDVMTGPGVLAVTPDSEVEILDAGFLPTLGQKPVPNVKSVFTVETDALRLWSEGVTGKGTTVALIDTGVTHLPDFNDVHGNSRLVKVADWATPGGPADLDCVDFSGEGHCGDSYGHGTFVAGIIAGNGYSSGAWYAGMAPEANILSIKIAGRDGSADVSKVLAAIQWVVSFRDEYGIDVLNLSLGTNSRADWRVDPLNLAVQRAWRDGIAVVVSAGNLGPGQGTIAKPADDPLVITTGAVDDRETPATSDDLLPNFSSQGPTRSNGAIGLPKPDITAPGAHIVSLRAPGSFIDEELTKAGRPGLDAAHRRGSGTSFAAGVVSGAVALMLDANETWTPDRVKFALANTASRGPSADPNKVGAGIVNAWKAAREAGPGLANLAYPGRLAMGTGTLDDSRGDVYVTGKECGVLEAQLDPMCAAVHGQTTAQNRTYDAKEYAEGDWTGASWYDSQWSPGGLVSEVLARGGSWYESEWYRNDWSGGSWYGASWYGQNYGTSYGLPLLGGSWYGAWD